jgi:hypothetical protein
MVGHAPGQLSAKEAKLSGALYPLSTAPVFHPLESEEGDWTRVDVVFKLSSLAARLTFEAPPGYHFGPAGGQCRVMPSLPAMRSCTIRGGLTARGENSGATAAEATTAESHNVIDLDFTTALPPNAVGTTPEEKYILRVWVVPSASGEPWTMRAAADTPHLVQEVRGRGLKVKPLAVAPTLATI